MLSFDAAPAAPADAPLLPDASWLGAKTPDTPAIHVLVIEGQGANGSAVREMLELEGYANIRVTADLDGAVRSFTPTFPDIVVLDLHLVAVGGGDTIRSVCGAIPEGEYLPVLVTSGDIMLEARQVALASGAVDFLQKPFEREHLSQRIRAFLNVRSLCRTLREENRRLTRRFQEQAEGLNRDRDELIDRLAALAEYRDDPSGEHPVRVGRLSAAVARELGFVPDAVELIARAAALHDIGRIGLPDALLGRTKGYTADEWELVKAHPLVGSEILARVESDVLRMAEQIVLNHHEQWDGGGYPRGLRAEEIPLAARIVAAVDHYDGLRHPLDGEGTLERDEAVATVRRASGSRFDPEVVAALERVVQAEAGRSGEAEPGRVSM